MGSSAAVHFDSGPSLVLRDVEIDGRGVDVLVADNRIAAIEARLSRTKDVTFSDERPRPEEELQGDGGALLPGLHDHHVHLLSMAARVTSFDLNSCHVEHLNHLDRLGAMSDLHRSTTGDWLRVIGYQESMGDIDRDVLDGLDINRPIRVQHRSGAMWVLNSLAIDCVHLESSGHEGIERDRDGRVTGRLFGLDAWLGAAVGPEPMDLFAVAAQLHAFGVTGVTDLTPVSDPSQVAPVLDAARRGLALRITVSPSPQLADSYEDWSPLSIGPVKVYLADHSLPTYDEVCSSFHEAHASGRCVAVHSVTRVSLALALAAWHEVGTMTGDRLEHGSLIPVESIDDLAVLGVTVVTQPNFIFDRGDDYLHEVPPIDLGDLYRCRSLMEAGVAVSFGTDFPFGQSDPWLAISAATERRSYSGHSIGPGETIEAQSALSMFLTRPTSPAGPPRQLTVGGVADLCLLDRPLIDALARPSSAFVRATVVGGDVVFFKS